MELTSYKPAFSQDISVNIHSKASISFKLCSYAIGQLCTVGMASSGKPVVSFLGPIASYSHQVMLVLVILTETKTHANPLSRQSAKFSQKPLGS